MRLADNKEIDGPKEMYKIIAYVNELGYTDVPNYDKIRDYLLDGAKDEKVGVDWVCLIGYHSARFDAQIRLGGSGAKEEVE